MSMMLCSMTDVHGAVLMIGARFKVVTIFGDQPTAILYVNILIYPYNIYRHNNGGK